MLIVKRLKHLLYVIQSHLKYFNFRNISKVVKKFYCYFEKSIKILINIISCNSKESRTIYNNFYLYSKRIFIILNYISKLAYSSLRCQPERDPKSRWCWTSTNMCARRRVNKFYRHRWLILNLLTNVIKKLAFHFACRLLTQQWNVCCKFAATVAHWHTHTATPPGISSLSG